jgi:hypothetical protein
MQVDGKLADATLFAEFELAQAEVELQSFRTSANTS